MLNLFFCSLTIDPCISVSWTVSVFGAVWKDKNVWDLHRHMGNWDLLRYLLFCLCYLRESFKSQNLCSHTRKHANGLPEGKVNLVRFEQKVTCQRVCKYKTLFLNVCVSCNHITPDKPLCLSTRFYFICHCRVHSRPPDWRPCMLSA